MIYTVSQNVDMGRRVPGGQGLARPGNQARSQYSSLLRTWPTETLSKIILLSGPYCPHLGKGHVMLDMCLLDMEMVKHRAPRFKCTSHKCSSK